MNEQPAIQPGQGAQRVTAAHHRWRHPTWPRALLLYAGLAVFFYLPVLLGLRSFPDGDFTHHFLPFSQYLQAELLAGRLPVWNPHTYAGHPFLADTQAAVFYPVGDLLLLATLWLTDPGARLFFLQVEAILHIVLAGFFTYLLARDLTGSRGAAFLAGAVFAFSGYLTGYPPVQLAVLRTAVWLPLLLWALLRATARPGRWGWWLAAGVIAAVAWLAGHPQTFLFTGYAAAAWTLLLLVAAWRRMRGAGQKTLRPLLLLLAGVLLAAGVALGLAAAQLLPSLEFVGLSVRADTAYAFVSGGFPLQDTWQLFLPGVLTVYSPLYVGVAALGLAVLALFGRRGGNGQMLEAPLSLRAGVWFFGLLSLLALLAAYGGNGPLYPLLYHLAPGWNLFRGQERAAYLVAFGLSMLAGYGAVLLPAMRQGTRARIATAYAAAVIGGVYVFGLLWQLPGRTAIGETSYLLLAAATVLLATGFAMLLRWPGWSERRSLILAALVIGNLFAANMGTNLGAFSPARAALLPPEVAALQAAAAETASGGAPGRVYNEFRVYEDYSMRAGVEDVWGASPLRLERYAALFAEFPLDRLWRLMGVEHVLTWRRELFEPSDLLAEFPQAADTTYLHRLRAANPRAWLVGQVRAADDATAAQFLADHTFDLERIALLPGVTGTQVSGEVASGDVRLEQVAPGHLRVAVASATGGLLLLAENWMPGWQVAAATCDGGACPAGVWPAAELPYLAPVRANLTLVGVPVPAGAVTFDLVYRPDSVRAGLWITGVVLALLLLALGYRSVASGRNSSAAALSDRSVRRSIKGR